MPKADSSELEGLWTIPLHESEFSLILCNTADQGQSVTLRMTAENHREWTGRFWLGSRETRVVDRQQHAPMDRLLSSARLGGISARYSGQPGSLLIRGMIADSGVGYSTEPFAKFGVGHEMGAECSCKITPSKGICTWLAMGFPLGARASRPHTCQGAAPASVGG